MYGKLSASGPVPTSFSAPVPRSMLYVYAENGFARTAATRKRLSPLTVIGITGFSALKRSPGFSEPSRCKVYMPISPSSAFDTYTNVAAIELLTASENVAASAAFQAFAHCMVIPPQGHLIGKDIAGVG